jgi:hypothetical protein
METLKASDRAQVAMTYRKLRIAWSVGWGVVAVLLIVLWIRSYWWTDILAHTGGQTYVAVSTSHGITVLRCCQAKPLVTLGNKLGWDLQESPAATSFGGLKPLEWKFDRANTAFVFDLAISVPCFCCASFFALLAVLPWELKIPSRFSLRTLLIATTLVAVALGVIVYAVK